MPANRTKTGRFQKGQSGNPCGRPKTTQGQKDALQQIRDLAPRAAEEMQRILDDPDSPQALKLRVAEMVFDRAFGKPRPGGGDAIHHPFRRGKSRSGPPAGGDKG